MTPNPKANRDGWLATWLQDRRRKRQQQTAPTPNAPVITLGMVDWEVTTPGYGDVYIEFTFALGSFPPAALEVWGNINGGGFVLWGVVETIYSDFTQRNATTEDVLIEVKLRYVNGAIVGPFSPVYQILPQG